MVSLVLLVLVVAAVALALTRRGSMGAPGVDSLSSSASPASAGAPAPRRPEGPEGTPASLSHELARWRHAGLISEEQAAAIQRFEAPHALRQSHPRRVPALAEAVGYIGAILALTGLGLIVARYWAHINTPARLVLSAGLGLGLGLGGGLVREGAELALRRLRWILWLGASAAAGLFSVVATRAVGRTEPRGEVVVLVTALVVGALSGLLWRGRFRPLQEALTLGAPLVALGALSRLLGTDTWMAAGVFVGALVLLGLGVGRLIVTPWLAELVGAGGLWVAAIMFLNFSRGPGGVASVASALGLLVLAVSARPVREPGEARLLGVAGALVLSQSLPPTLGYFAAHAGLATGGLVWLASAFVILASTRLTMRVPGLLRLAGALGVLLGAALSAAQYPKFAPALGLLSAIGLLALGTRPGELGLSLVGSVGLLINVPWLILKLFPGQVRAPLVILITGALFVGLAITLARERIHVAHHPGQHRFRH